jgi:hypothetical protein
VPNSGKIKMERLVADEIASDNPCSRHLTGASEFLPSYCAKAGTQVFAFVDLPQSTT